MSKIIKLSESDLINIVKKVIQEQNPSRNEFLTRNVCRKAQDRMLIYNDFGDFYQNEDPGSGYLSFVNPKGEYQGMDVTISYDDNKIYIHYGDYMQSADKKLTDVEKQFKSIFDQTFKSLGPVTKYGSIEFGCRDVEKFMVLLSQFVNKIYQKTNYKLQ